LPNKRQAVVRILRAFGDLPVCKDVVVTTPQDILQSGKVVGSVLHSAPHEGCSMNDPETTVASRSP
jgi:hypothetical protein